MSISLTLITKGNRPISTTSYPIVLQIPSTPIVLETTTKDTIVHLNHNQYGNDDERLLTKHKSLIAMILPLRMKVKLFTFNVDRSPTVLLFSSS